MSIILMLRDTIYEGYSCKAILQSLGLGQSMELAPWSELIIRSFFCELHFALCIVLVLTCAVYSNFNNT